ncbi:MAG TPA: MFS transporter [Egibacteraceae bacterium]|nr:MFS transporter [Egibacteraceae bacterium]
MTSAVPDAVTAPPEEDPPGQWAALALLSGAMVLAMTTWFSASAALPQLVAEWRLSSTGAAWLTIAVQLGFVAGGLISAGFSLADVIAPKRLILLGATGAATANLLLLAVTGPAPALVLRFLTGMFLAGVYPPALKEMATWFRRGRGTALGIMVGALTLGSATPHLVNGLGGADWRVVIVVTSTLTLAGGAMTELTARDGPFPFPKAPFDPRQIGRALHNRGVRLASAGYFGHMWELYAMWAWFAAFYASALSARAATDPQVSASIATFAVIGVGLLGCWAGGILGDRWGRTRTTALAMGVSGTCSLIIGLLHGAPPWVLLTVGLIWGFWVVADSAQFSTMVTEVADQSYVGTALTLQLAIGFTLTVATIWLIPILRDALTWRWAFAFLAPGPLLGMLAMLRLSRLPEAAAIAGGRG